VQQRTSERFASTLAPEKKSLLEETLDADSQGVRPVAGSRFAQPRDFFHAGCSH
jgi:hypothetical protein